MTARSFHLGDILSVTTGYLVSPRAPHGIDAMYDLLNFMTGDNLFTHQLPRACDECKPELLRQHPQLADVKPPERFDDEAHVWRWLAEQVDRYGEFLDVAPLATSDHTVIDPIAELKMLRPDMPIIVVEVPGQAEAR